MGVESGYLFFCTCQEPEISMLILKIHLCDENDIFNYIRKWQVLAEDHQIVYLGPMLLLLKRVMQKHLPASNVRLSISV